MPHTALLFALGTITLWSFQAFLGASLTSVPFFLLVGTALTVSGLFGALKIRSWCVPWTTYAMGSVHFSPRKESLFQQGR